MAESKPTPREPYFWIFVIALVLRVILIFFGHTYKFYDHTHNFSFGWEMGSIGRSLAAGEGFSSPFGEPTGPTAWEPPLYPYLIAGVFKIFGIYSLTSAVVLLAINSVFSALTCIPIFWIARRCFNERVALWTCWLWALLPPIMAWATRWVWETSIAAFLLTLIFWLTLVMQECESSLALTGTQLKSDIENPRTVLLPWMLFGFIWAVAALLNTSLLAFLPISGLWVWRQRWKSGKSSLAGVVLASVVFLACISPWTIRNYHTFQKLFLIRSNFGAELRLGNGPGADGTWMQKFHPTQNAHEMSRYRGMGEIDYIAVRKQEAYTFIREDVGQFLILCGKRFVYYWTGVPRPDETLGRRIFRNSLYSLSSFLMIWGLVIAFKRRVVEAWLFLGLLLSYPAIYYVVFPHPRYRHPIESEMGILIVYGLAQSSEKTEQ
jgi:4-amino-4-deoxy-L-arabinose transferase-like glycosyltransferase